MHYATIDVGSPAKGNLGWFITGPVVTEGGTDPHTLISNLSVACSHGPVVLGFEAPMFVPCGRQAAALLKARPGEGSRSWSVAAGATTTAVAMAIVPWVLNSLVKRHEGLRGWQDWHRMPTRSREVLVFEAFVSGGASDGHVADAKAATMAAISLFEGGDEPITSALEPEACFSVLGAALLHAGLTDDVSELHRACLVVRAAKALSVVPNVR